MLLTGFMPVELHKVKADLSSAAAASAAAAAARIV